LRIKRADAQPISTKSNHNKDHVNYIFISDAHPVANTVQPTILARDGSEDYLVKMQKSCRLRQ